MSSEERNIATSIEFPRLCRKFCHRTENEVWPGILPRNQLITEFVCTSNYRHRVCVKSTFHVPVSNFKQPFVRNVKQVSNTRPRSLCQFIIQVLIELTILDQRSFRCNTKNFYEKETRKFTCITSLRGPSLIFINEKQRDYLKVNISNLGWFFL